MQYRKACVLMTSWCVSAFSRSLMKTPYKPIFIYYECLYLFLCCFVQSVCNLEMFGISRLHNNSEHKLTEDTAYKSSFIYSDCSLLVSSLNMIYEKVRVVYHCSYVVLLVFEIIEMFWILRIHKMVCLSDFIWLMLGFIIIKAVLTDLSNTKTNLIYK